jgi:hypothetical protein
MDGDVLDASGLCSWPMDTRRSGARCNASQVKNHVPNLAVENVGGAISLVSSVLIRVCVNQAKADKVRSGLEGWKAVRVANELGEVVVNDRRGNQIGSSREVDNSRSGSRGLAAAGSTPTTRANGRIDSSGIVLLVLAWRFHVEIEFTSPVTPSPGEWSVYKWSSLRRASYPLRRSP